MHGECNIRKLSCGIHPHSVGASLDMFETKWEGEMGLPEPDRQLMSDVELNVICSGPSNVERLCDCPDDPFTAD